MHGIWSENGLLPFAEEHFYSVKR